jgi:ABC-type multidrug transport system fused ATPase/permease subunit
MASQAYGAMKHFHVILATLLSQWPNTMQLGVSKRNCCPSLMVSLLMLRNKDAAAARAAAICYDRWVSTQPQHQQRNRFRVTIANRLLRLATLTFAAVNSSPSVMARMTTRVNSANRSNTSQLMQLMRPIVGPPLVYLNHSGYVLPFAWVLPFQLYTLAACSFIIASSVCVLSQSEEYALMATRACRTLKTGMFYGSMLLGGPVTTRLPAAATQAGGGQGIDGSATHSVVVELAGWRGGCYGAEAVLLLHVFAYVVILVVLPLLVVYFVELSLKTNYLRQKERRQQQHEASAAEQLALPEQLLQQLQFSPMVDSTWVRVLVSYVCVVGAFHACNAAVTLLPPLSCDI